MSEGRYDEIFGCLRWYREMKRYAVDLGNIRVEGVLFGWSHAELQGCVSSAEQ